VYKIILLNWVQCVPIGIGIGNKNMKMNDLVKKVNHPKLPLKRRLVHIFHSFLSLSKIDRVVAHYQDINGSIILMYHSVASNGNERWVDPSNHINKKIFEKHMKFLANKRNVISLDDLIIFINENRPLPIGTTVITLDDGYLDNLTEVAPILKKYNLPAIIYLATGYIGREENQWIDQLYTYFKERTNNRLLILEISNKQMILNDSDSTWSVYSEIAKYLIESTYKQRVQVLTSIENQLLPKHKPPKLTMNWDDVRTLINNNKNITLGSHTNNHIDLSGLNKKAVELEIKICSEDIKRETGRIPVHFSCPYSRFSEYLPRILKNMEYGSSVSDSSDIIINSKSYPYRLGRVKAPVSLLRLAHYTSGNYPRISKFLLRGRY